MYLVARPIVHAALDKITLILIPYKSELVLEPRQYKNNSIQSKIIPTLKLPRFSPRIRFGKKRGNRETSTRYSMVT